MLESLLKMRAVCTTALTEQGRRLPQLKTSYLFWQWTPQPLFGLLLMSMLCVAGMSPLKGQTISTVAGTGIFGNTGDGKAATSARLASPTNIAVDGAGNMYIADKSNHRVRKVSYSTGIITTVAGTGKAGFTGDDGPATAAQLNEPYGVAIDESGNLFISDLNNSRIRKVSSKGTITTIAGIGTKGYSGDGGFATAAQLNTAIGLSVDKGGNLFIADASNHRIRKINAEGIISTVAGTGIFGSIGDGKAATSARLAFPSGVAVDQEGNIYIADQSNERIRKVLPSGIITTIAGIGSSGFSGDNGPAKFAELNTPASVAVDGAGNVFVAEYDNSRIRLITAEGIISTVAGTGENGYSGDGGLAVKAKLQNPYGVAVDKTNSLFIADRTNNSVRKVTFAKLTATITSSAGSSGSFTNNSPVPFTVTFSDVVVDFAKTDIIATGGTLANFAGSGTTYTFTVTPIGDGVVTVDVPAGIAKNAVATPNMAASQFKITYQQPVTAMPLIVTPANGSTDNPAKPIYAGTASADASVNVFVDEQLVGTPTANNVGKWSLTQPTVLVSGLHKVYAIAQNSGWAASLPSVATMFTVMSGDANLSSLISSGGALSPAFSPATTTYTTVVDGAVQSIELTPIIDDKYASLKINSVAVISSNTVDIPLSIGSNTITIQVTAQDGTTKTYTLIVTRNQSSQTITFNAIPEKVYGDAEFKLGASASSGLPINYESGNPAVATVDAAGNVQIIKAGTVEFTVAQKGDGSYATATSVKQTLVVKPAPLTIQANNQCMSGSDLPKLTLTYIGFVKDETALNLTKQPTVTTTAIAKSKAGSYPITVVGAESDNYAIKYSNGTLTVAGATLIANGIITCDKPTVTLTATGGNSYALSDGQTNKTGEFTVSKEGEYTVTVTTAEGCVATDKVTVSGLTLAPQVTLTNNGPLTCAKSTVTLTASPTVPNCSEVSYVYSGPGLVDSKASFGKAEVNAAGVYSVTLTDGYGCTATAETTVGADKEVPTIVLTSDGSLSCTKTSVTLTATGGVSYQFDGGVDTQQGNTAIVTKAGTYSVKAKAANGCTATQQVIIIGDQTAPTAGLTTNGSLTCDQPTVLLTASGGQSYQFSKGVTVLGENTATVGEAGVYSVTVTAPNGCTAVATTTVTGDQLAPTAELTNSGLLTCDLPTVTLTATGKGSYRFSQGASQIERGNTANVSTAGVYSVTVTSVNGCTATAQTTVKANNDLPVASLSSSGPLTCAKPTATLTASGTGSYRFSLGAVQINSSNTATVETAGVYSVTVTSENGCAAVATTSVELNSEIKAPILTASALVTEKLPVQVTASGCAGTISWTVQGGTGVANGAVYTLSQLANYTLTARCTVGTCTSTDATPLLVSIRPGDFAIASVNTENCQLVDASRGEYWVTFTPIYSGLSGNPASFSIVNEIVSTTATAPYTVRLYADNPVVTLVATQANGSQAQFAYSWRAICAGNVTTNRAPVVTTIPDQQLVQNQPYQLDLTAYFADPDGQILTFTTSQLPAGLNLSGGRISGRPTGSGVSEVMVTALDPAGIQVSTSVRLRITAAGGEPSTTNFAITGVSTVTCVAVSASERRVSFSPLYSGLNGTPIRFRVVNEIDATTDAGPYAIRLYTDNPVVKLEAVQSGVTATYSYAWLSTCDTPTPPPTPTPTNRPPVVVIPLVTQTATVGQGYSLYISRNTFTDPDGGALILTAEGLPAGLSYSTSLSAVTGTPASVGTSTIWITATDPGGLSVSSSFELTVIAAPVTPTEPPVPPTSDFAITGVSTVTCVAVSASERRVSFSPLYSGLNGTPIRFRVVNEIDATTDAGPYAIRLYTDNPVVKLEAVQSGVTATYSYAWLSTCDTPTLPPTPTVPTEPSTPTEPTVPVTPPSTEFAITGVTTVNCEVVTASERRVTFTPQYTGAGSGPISFRVVNEIDATTAAGPYSIRLYTDNPVVTLRAEQNAKVASFRYEWLKGCTPNGRQGALEAVRPLAVTVLGNPVVGESAEVVIDGADGQALQVQVVDLVGNVVYQRSIPRASASERLSVPLGRSQGLLLLHVSTPSQRQQIKLIRP